MLCRKEWEEVKGAGREPEKGECKERGVIKKLREVEVRREGMKAEEERVGSSWWELMLEKENEEWKKVKRKKEDNRRAREERRKR